MKFIDLVGTYEMPQKVREHAEKVREEAWREDAKEERKRANEELQRRKQEKQVLISPEVCAALEYPTLFAAFCLRLQSTSISPKGANKKPCESVLCT
jgi:hypothetical protein